MNVEIGIEAAQLPEKEYINGISVAVRNFVVAHLHFSEHFTLCLYLKLVFWVAALTSSGSKDPARIGKQLRPRNCSR